VTQGIRKQTRAVLESKFCQGISPEQGLVNFIFRGVFAKGLDSQFFMTVRSQGPIVYPSWSAIYYRMGCSGPRERRMNGWPGIQLCPRRRRFNLLQTGLS
jgi:hypothetical protein